MRFHWQNLHEDSCGSLEVDVPRDSLRGLWRHGRAWLGALRVEWCLGELDWMSGFKARLMLNEHDGDVTALAAVPGADIYVTLPLPRALVELLPFQYRRSEYGGWSRTIGAELTGEHLRWSVWEDGMEHRASDPAWMSGSVDLGRLVLGKLRVEKTDIEVRRIKVQMPEGVYTGSALLSRYVSRRSRVPWPVDDSHRVCIDLDKPIPIPGNGESDYDQDDDGVYSMYVTTASIAEAVDMVARRAIADRVNRGGSPRMPASTS